MDLRLNEENWVALAVCVTLAVLGLIRLAVIAQPRVPDGVMRFDEKGF